jgi:formylmethanofuran dehydrogenase subunit E
MKNPNENSSVKCRQCDATVPVEQASDADGHPLCQDCADVLCRTCGLSAGYHEVNGITMCDSCFETRSDGYDADSDRYWG